MTLRFRYHRDWNQGFGVQVKGTPASKRDPYPFRNFLPTRESLMLISGFCLQKTEMSLFILPLHEHINYQQDKALTTRG